MTSGNTISHLTEFSNPVLVSNNNTPVVLHVDNDVRPKTLQLASGDDDPLEQVHRNVGIHRGTKFTVLLFLSFV